MSQEIQIAFIAASAALAGVVISQAISIALSVFDKRHKKHILLRQKYEEMMFEFQNSLKYVQEVHNCETLPQLYQLSSSPQTGKAYGLAQLYFPSLVEPLSKYVVAQFSFYTSVITIFDKNIPINAGGQAMANNRHRQIVEGLLKEKGIVMDALILNAKKYTKA